MNDPILAPGGEHGESAAAAWPRTAALFGVLVLCALAATLAALALPDHDAKAHHFGTLQSNQNTLTFDCGPIGQMHADPFADELGVTDTHQHFFRDNTAITRYGEDVTAEQLTNNLETTCGPSWATGLEWNPMTRDPRNGVHSQTPITTYYFRNGVASPSQLRHLPHGAKLLARGSQYITFNCTPGFDQSNVTKTPPYGCDSNVVKVRIKFPQCWDQKGINPQNFTYPSNGSCGTGKVPVPELSISMGIRTPYDLAYPLEISSGHSSWSSWQFYHADFWATMQQGTSDGQYHPPIGFRESIEACVMKPLSAPRYSYCTHPGSNDL